MSIFGEPNVSLESMEKKGRVLLDKNALDAGNA
jgi:hypothetical protein